MYGEFLLWDFIGDKEKYVLGVLACLACQHTAILRLWDGGFMILIKHITFDCITLRFHETFTPHHNPQYTGNANEFRYNTDVIKTATRGWFRSLHVWLNKIGMLNLISIPVLEADGCDVATETKEVWILRTYHIWR